MLVRTAILCTLFFAATSVGADDPDIYRMMVGSNVMEVAQTRQLTFLEHGDVLRVAVSRNGGYAAYVTVQPNIDSIDRIVRLYVVNLSRGKPILLMEGGIGSS